MTHPLIIEETSEFIDINQLVNYTFKNKLNQSYSTPVKENMEYCDHQIVYDDNAVQMDYTNQPDTIKNNNFSLVEENMEYCDNQKGPQRSCFDNQQNWRGAFINDYFGLFENENNNDLDQVEHFNTCNEETTLKKPRIISQIVVKPPNENTKRKPLNEININIIESSARTSVSEKDAFQTTFEVPNISKKKKSTIKFEGKAAYGRDDLLNGIRVKKEQEELEEEEKQFKQKKRDQIQFIKQKEKEKKNNFNERKKQINATLVDLRKRLKQSTDKDMIKKEIKQLETEKEEVHTLIKKVELEALEEQIRINEETKK